MTLREHLHQSLKEVEQEYGPDEPYAQALRRQLAEIEQETKSGTGKSELMIYSAGMRQKSRPSSKSSSEQQQPSKPQMPPTTEE
jgi:hypothetical protein